MDLKSRIKFAYCNGREEGKIECEMNLFGSKLCASNLETDPYARARWFEMAFLYPSPKDLRQFEEWDKKLDAIPKPTTILERIAYNAGYVIYAPKGYLIMRPFLSRIIEE